MNQKTENDPGDRQMGLPRARARFLAQAIELEEEGVSGAVRGAVFFSFFLLIAVITWMTVTAVNEMSVSRGEVVPAGYIHNIQHLEGGIVNEIAVHDGDFVKKGDLLVGFAPPATQSEYDQLAIRRATLLLDLERMQAIESGKAPDFGDLGKKYPELARKQLESYRAQRSSFENEMAVVSAQINQKSSELLRQKNQIEVIEKEIDLLNKQVRMRQELADKRIVSQTDLLAMQSNLASAESGLKSVKDGVVVASMALEEAKKRRAEVASGHKRDLKVEATVVASRLAEMNESLVKAKDKVSRLKIAASVSGIIQGLAVTGINEVVKPGATILQIVPVDDDLIVEARVLPNEIGHIQAGQKAEIKVDSYDSARFGLVKGIVKQLSPSTYLDEKMNPYYRAKIELEKSYVGSNPDQMKIIPGMTVQVNIITGSKTIMEYLLKPVTRGFDGAFKEH